MALFGGVLPAILEGPAVFVSATTAPARGPGEHVLGSVGARPSVLGVVDAAPRVLGSVEARPFVLGAIMINRKQTLYISEDNNLIWDNMRKESDGSAIDGATVLATVKTTTGAVFSGIQNVTLSNVTTGGNYLGVIDSTSAANFVENQEYDLEITATSSDIDAFRRQRCVAQYHQFRDV